VPSNLKELNAGKSELTWIYSSDNTAFHIFMYYLNKKTTFLNNEVKVIRNSAVDMRCMMNILIIQNIFIFYWCTGPWIEM
jgi:hypothetical protein